MGVLEDLDVTDLAPVAHTCPRCGGVAEQRFAGPCARCIAELRSTMRADAREVESEYVPKMNVTPNAVALKDD
jgi:hypothetical protein